MNNYHDYMYMYLSLHENVQYALPKVLVKQSHVNACTLLCL